MDGYHQKILHHFALVAVDAQSNGNDFEDGLNTAKGIATLKYQGAPKIKLPPYVSAVVVSR